ncbi:MAG: tetratricopeptide repeat protein [Candidatus Sericytochromatia bacterium]|nr:tetratricopeptide repeat protein [Candidatus Sericytochromatia bacterium]
MRSAYAEEAFDRDYAEGLALLQQQAFETALIPLRRSTRTQPRSENFFALGVALFRLQRLPEAWQAYQQALRYLPDPALKARIRSGLGDLHFATEDYVNAINHYHEALDYEPRWNGARLRLATAYLRLERYSAALTITEQALAYAGPAPQPELHALRSLIYLSQQQWQAATTELSALAEYPGYFVEAQQHLNWMYRFRKDYPEANTLADQLLQSHGQPEIWQMAALTKLEYLNACDLQLLPCSPGHYQQLSQEAGEVLSRWILSTPDQPQAYYYLGLWAQHRLDWPAALQAYQRAAQLFPERQYYQLKQAEMHWTLGERQPAEKTLSVLRFQKGDWREGFKAYAMESLPSAWQQAALQNDPASPQGLFWQGYLHWQQAPGDKNKAWHTLLSQHSSSPEARLAEALQLLRSGNRTWTYALLRQTARERPENWLSAYYLGILQAEHDCPAALPWLQRAYRQNPTALAVHHGLLRCLPPEQQAAQLIRSLQTFPSEDAFQQLYLELQR